MHIYIDESGIFRNPANKENVASCIAALCVPTTKTKQLFSQFKKVAHAWKDENGEVKGKSLNEEQVASVITLLRKFDVILELIIIDLGLHTEGEITKFKELHVANMKEYILFEQRPDLVKRIKDIQAVFGKMSNQLFVQVILMFLLIPRTLFNMVLYYSRRIPEELQWFYWMVDAKGQSKNEYEEAWSTVLLPIMAGQTARNPMPLIPGGDYSYFQKFQEFGTDAIRKIAIEKGLEEGDIVAVRLKEVLGKHFEFQDSRWSVGLQMADILANAAQRALNRKLGVTGWGEIGRLMIHRNPNPVQFIEIRPDAQDEEIVVRNSPFWGQLHLMGAKAKPIWLDLKDELG